MLTGLPDGKRRRGNVEKLLEKAETSGRITLERVHAVSRGHERERSARGRSRARKRGRGAVDDRPQEQGAGISGGGAGRCRPTTRSAGGSDLVSGLGCKVYDDDEEQARFDVRASPRRAAGADCARKPSASGLLYVAATRAQDYLIVSGQVTCKDDQPLAAKRLARRADRRARTGRSGGGNARSSLTTGARRGSISRSRWTTPTSADEAVVDWDDVRSRRRAAAAAQRCAERRRRARPLADGDADRRPGQRARGEPVREPRLSSPSAGGAASFTTRPARIDPAGGAAWAQVGEIVHQARALGAAGRRRRAARGAAPLRLGKRAGRRRRERARRRERLRSARAGCGAATCSRRIARARAVYREVPFVYQAGGRTIHGVIDLLLQDRIRSMDRGRLQDSVARRFATATRRWTNTPGAIICRWAFTRRRYENGRNRANRVYTLYSLRQNRKDRPEATGRMRSLGLRAMLET